MTRPAIAAPGRYGLGSDTGTVHAALRALEPRVRGSWAGQYRSPESLLAATAASDWLRADPHMDTRALLGRIAAHTFSADKAVDSVARVEALRMAHTYVAAATPGRRRMEPIVAMITTIPCNDTPATTDIGAWHGIIRRYAVDYPAAISGDLMNPCLFWGGPRAVKPSVSALAEAGRILVISAEFDTTTPVGGALNLLNALPNASMLVVRGLERHSVFTLTDHACVERTAARFMLDGRRPSEQITECHVDPETTPEGPHFRQPQVVGAWRQRLARQLEGGERRALFGHVSSVAD